MFTNETTSFILRCVRKTIWMLLVLWGIDHPRQLLCYPSGSGDADGHADDAEPPCGGSGAGSS